MTQMFIQNVICMENSHQISIRVTLQTYAFPAKVPQFGFEDLRATPETTFAFVKKHPAWVSKPSIVDN